jgi:hypothetical protein
MALNADICPFVISPSSSNSNIILLRACNLTWFSPCLTGPVD